MSQLTCGLVTGVYVDVGSQGRNEVRPARRLLVVDNQKFRGERREKNPHHRDQHRPNVRISSPWLCGATNNSEERRRLWGRSSSWSELWIGKLSVSWEYIEHYHCSYLPVQPSSPSECIFCKLFLVRPDPWYCDVMGLKFDTRPDRGNIQPLTSSLLW